MSALSVILVAVALAVAGLFAFLPALRRSDGWQATVVPLASIMGSGFLVSAPLLGHTVGRWAMPAMAGLLVVAYALGHVIRFNIANAEPQLEDADRDERDHTLQHAHRQSSSASASAGTHAAAIVERVSHAVLALAYVVTIAYYLQLLAAFALEQLGHDGDLTAKIIASSILAGLTLVGATFGLGLLEKLDRFAIALNLGVIAAILVGLVVHNVHLVNTGGWQLPAGPSGSQPVHTTRVLMGLLIVVQGFETSRFLGSEHPAEVRIRTMRIAQLVSSGIYVVFLALVTVLLGSSSGDGADVTAVVSLLTPVAPVLPLLVVCAAIVSQFSAAVADDSGDVGLVQTLLGGWGPRWLTYALIGGLSAGVIWLTNPVEVIAWASRSFALFYALQCAVAVLTAHTADVSHATARKVAYGALGVVALAVCILGIPAG